MSTPESCKEYYHKNAEGILAQKQGYYRETRDARLAYAKSRHDSIRQRVLDLLGHKCARCGFSDDRALQIDHINGNGRKDRGKCRSPHKFYEKVLVVGSAEYQILCANCNTIKRHEMDENPKKRLLED